MITETMLELLSFYIITSSPHDFTMVTHTKTTNLIVWKSSVINSIDYINGVILYGYRWKSVLNSPAGQI